EHDQRRNSHLVDTLKAYLATDRSVGAAAASLNMHRNTLSKRLERIEALLGLSLTANDDLVSLTLGLRAWELLAGDTERATGVVAGGLTAWEAAPARPLGRAGASTTR
ncbi:MAG: helix-turn-helix domain-containing protein, partial [Thermoleophilia bacterium]|nr:helix-turn-helix domain-containing protein [Thermoleophilia bacterium]